MDNITPAIQYLQDHNIPHRIFQHAGPVESLEQAARERAQQPEQVVRSIVFRLSENEFIMVLMPGPDQVPWKALRHHLGQSRLTMASEAELLSTTGYRPGTVTPFGIPTPMRILVDAGILALDEVSLGSGRRGLAILIRPQDMLSALADAEVIKFKEG